MHLQAVAEDVQVPLQAQPELPGMGTKGQVNRVVVDDGSAGPQVCFVDYGGVVVQGIVMGNVVVQTLS